MLLVTAPHSGEVIPPEATWLQGVEKSILLTDIDRYVHELYGPAAKALQCPFVVADFHRYVVDLNRTPADIDSTQVEGAPAPGSGPARFVSGFHWVRTTKGDTLMAKPMARSTHDALVQAYYEPFHAAVREAEAQLIATHGMPRFHIDAHSMPSVGAPGAHKDAGQRRPDIVVSDCEGKSSGGGFKDLVIAAYEAEGFTVAYNWPYKGGRMTEHYGRPAVNRHSVQVELNRSLYMDEGTRQKHSGFLACEARIRGALGRVVRELAKV
jgi:N-formylglutamate amidohydrolase